MVAEQATVRAYKTAVFRLHNPSRHKRAMLTDALTRHHLAYSKLLSKLLPHVDTFAKIKAGKKRESEIYRYANPIVKPLPLAIGAKASLISDRAAKG